MFFSFFFLVFHLQQESTLCSKALLSIAPRLESYMGLVFGFIACIYAAVVSDVKQSLVVTMISCMLPYVWFWFVVAHEPSIISSTAGTLLLLQRLFIAQLLIYFALVLDFGVMNIVYLIQAVNIMVGAINSKAGAFILGLSSLYLYKLEADYVLSVENGAFWWLVGWGIVTSVLSYGWLALFYKTYCMMKNNKNVFKELIGKTIFSQFLSLLLEEHLIKQTIFAQIP